MLNRINRINCAPAVVAVLVIVLTCRSSGAEPAGDDCIAKPNSVPPQGSHWYYRVDRTANRRCWFLGPEGLKPRYVEQAKRLPSVTPSVQPTLESRADVQPTLASRVEANASQSAAYVSSVSQSTGLSDRGPTSLNDNAEEHTDSVSLKSDAAAERSNEAIATEQSPEVAVTKPEPASAPAEDAAVSVRPEQVLAIVAGLLVLVAVVLFIFYRPFGIESLVATPKLRAQRRSAARTPRPRAGLLPAHPNKNVAGREANVARESLSLPRSLSVAREPLSRAYATHELEKDLRRLLYSERRAA